MSSISIISNKNTISSTTPKSKQPEPSFNYSYREWRDSNHIEEEILGIEIRAGVEEKITSNKDIKYLILNFSSLFENEPVNLDFIKEKFPSIEIMELKNVHLIPENFNSLNQMECLTKLAIINPSANFKICDLNRLKELRIEVSNNQKNQLNHIEIDLPELEGLMLTEATGLVSFDLSYSEKLDSLYIRDNYNSWFNESKNGLDEYYRKSPLGSELIKLCPNLQNLSVIIEDGQFRFPKEIFAETELSKLRAVEFAANFRETDIDYLTNISSFKSIEVLQIICRHIPLTANIFSIVKKFDKLKCFLVVGLRRSKSEVTDKDIEKFRSETKNKIDFKCFG